MVRVEGEEQLPLIQEQRLLCLLEWDQNWVRSGEGLAPWPTVDHNFNGVIDGGILTWEKKKDRGQDRFRRQFLVTCLDKKLVTTRCVFSFKRKPLIGL